MPRLRRALGAVRLDQLMPPWFNPAGGSARTKIELQLGARGPGIGSAKVSEASRNRRKEGRPSARP